MALSPSLLGTVHVEGPPIAQNVLILVALG